ncbi:UNVERIFIED_CONTAM: hypothetical protein Sradi_3598300 [Sesamum radiatum]|uniref:Reverse transcriptase/retrotransposon-derived protein RNase H-like domain-containing protein n=1 Tax=Sesamum radiatum TaxID=300843 RepID=A0AAW2QI11_SESRA
MVTQWGIEANPNKIKAIMEMGPPTNFNEVQWLTGRIDVLSRFISKSAEKGLPFFKTIRKVKPVPGDTLYLYIYATSQAVSLVVAREEEGNQTPIYYLDRALDGGHEINCLRLGLERSKSRTSRMGIESPIEICTKSRIHWMSAAFHRPQTWVVYAILVVTCTKWLYLGFVREVTVPLTRSLKALSSAVRVCSEDVEFQEEDPSPVITWQWYLLCAW